jgi:hypothetical protein
VRSYEATKISAVHLPYTIPRILELSGPFKAHYEVTEVIEGSINKILANMKLFGAAVF